MSVERELAEDTRQWLRRALRDLQAGDADLASEHQLYEDTLFHAQQCAEKSIKAWLTWNQIVFRKTHDLRELGSQCRKIGPELDAALDEVEDLTGFASAGRYPLEEATDPPTREQALDGLERARRFYNHIAGLLPATART